MSDAADKEEAPKVDPVEPSKTEDPVVAKSEDAKPKQEDSESKDDKPESIKEADNADKPAAHADVHTGEEDEECLFVKRAKLFRFSKDDQEWKERGTGDIKILKHKETKKARVLMRREKILKVCANHQITSSMTLSANVGSDRSWVWNVGADISDGEPSAETLAVRFMNSEIAKEFHDVFDGERKACEKESEEK